MANKTNLYELAQKGMEICDTKTVGHYYEGEPTRPTRVCLYGAIMLGYSGNACIGSRLNMPLYMQTPLFKNKEKISVFDLEEYNNTSEATLREDVEALKPVLEAFEITLE